MFLGLFTELQAPGGIQRGSRHMAAVLAAEARRRGVACRLYSLNDPRGPHRDQVGDLAFEFAGFGRSKAGLVAATLRATAGRPILVFAAHPHLAPLAWMVKGATGARMAVVGWGIDVWDQLPHARRIALGAAEVVLAISSYTGNRMVQVQRVLPRSVRLLPLALEPALWRTVQEALGREETSEARRYLLSVTRLSAAEGYKGIDTVIRSLARLAPTFPELEYVIVGDGDDRPRLEQLSRELGLTHRVRFLGERHWVSGELSALYANCEAVVLPSRGEGFGLALLEGMAFGKPVVGGAHGGTPDIIEDGVTGFLTPYGEVDVLAATLRRILTDVTLRRKVGLQARERVRTGYLFEHFQARLGAVLDEVCAA
jgi:phosphatidylinositol alpha-1,6-mannosyltransferase